MKFFKFFNNIERKNEYFLRFFIWELMENHLLMLHDYQMFMKKQKKEIHWQLKKIFKWFHYIQFVHMNQKLFYLLQLLQLVTFLFFSRLSFF